jgi:thymidylate kinase
MLTQLAKDLARANIRYCVLHGWQSLPECLPSDLDVVVHPEDFSIFERILQEKADRRLVQSFQYEASSFFFVLEVGKDDQRRLVQVDAIVDYRRNGRIFWSGQELLAGRRWRNGFWVASPSTEFGYLLVKKVLKGRLPDRQKNRLGELCQEIGSESSRIVRRLFGRKLGDSVISWIRADAGKCFERNLRRLKRALLWEVIRRNPLNAVRFSLAEWKRIARRYRYPTGLSVVVLGPDGAGKSTVIENLRTGLSGAFRQAEVFHLRPYVFGRKGAHMPVTDPHGMPAHPWWLSLLKLPYYFLDYALGYVFNVHACLVRSTLVLFDRYYHDVLVDPRRYRYGGPIGLARLLRLFIPGPDLFLILDVPEGVLLARKREVSPEELTRQREAYRKLAASLPNSVLLDGSLPSEEVARNASDAVLDYLHIRYSERRPIWFRDNASETLKWLESVVFSTEKLRFAPSSPGNNGDRTRWHAREAFGWLSLNDGRGYLLPLDSRPAAISGLHLYNAQSVKAKVGKRMLCTALKRNVSWPLLPKIRIFNRQDVTQGESRVSLLAYLKEVFGDQDLTFAISLGTPGPHRKPVIQVLTRAGEALAYVKVGSSPTTNALVRNEAEIFQRFLGRCFSSFTTPKVLHADWWQDHFLCVQSALKGHAGNAPRSLTSQYLGVSQEISSVQIKRSPLEQSVFWSAFLRRTESVRNGYHRRILEQGLSRLEESLGDEPLPFHFCHGDFAPWNARLVDGRLFIFDWEYADVETPAGWDLFHFSVQTMQLLERRPPAEIHNAISNDGAEHRKIKAHLESLDVSADRLQSLFLLYLLDRLAFHAAEGEGSFPRLPFLTRLITPCLHS